jgi:H+/gluconate symporter-like permease
MSKIKPILIPIAIYFVWVLSTNLLEGRTNLLQNPDPIRRFTYTTIANIIIGTFVAICLLKRSLIASRFVTIKQSGFQPIKRTLIVVAITGAIGYFYFFVQYPLSL